LERKKEVVFQQDLLLIKKHAFAYHPLNMLGEISTKLASSSIFSPAKRTKCHIIFLWHPFTGWVMSPNKTHS
jgi:hypothetical protein